jgi:hypothetical protein
MKTVNSGGLFRYKAFMCPINIKLSMLYPILNLFLIHTRIKNPLSLIKILTAAKKHQIIVTNCLKGP